MIGAAIKNGAGLVCKALEKQFFKHRDRIRRTRYRLRYVYRAFWIALFGFGAIGVLTQGAEALLKMPADERGPLNALLPLAQWFNGYATESKLENVIGWLFSQWLFQALLLVIGIFIVCAGSIFLLWAITKNISTYSESRAEEKAAVLKKALRPVPSRSDIAVRFITVFVVVILGLHIAQVIAGWLGYCFIEANGCGISSLKEIVFMSLAAPGAVISIWPMLEARHQRRLARRQLHFKLSTIGRLFDVLKLVITAILVLIILGLLLLFGSALLDFV